MSQENVQEVLGLLGELCDDNTVPRNVKTKFQEISESLQEKGEISIKINKVLNDLDEIGDDINLQPYIRTQIWNIVSMLEKIVS